MGALGISARTLGELAQDDFCPRCFWLSLHAKGNLPFQMPMPGIFGSIAAYTPNLIRSYFDEQKKLPKWYPKIGPVKAYVDGRELHWSKFTVEDKKTGIELRGSPDDVFRLADGSYHIVDYKTAKLTTKQDELAPLYEVQLNAYAYICEMERKEFSPISGLSLIYMEPQTGLRANTDPEVVLGNGFALHFSATQKTVPLKPEKLIPGLLRQARAIYDQQPAPRGRAGCEDCDNFARVLNLIG